MNSSLRTGLAGTVLALGLFATPALGDTLDFIALLTGAEEVPPVEVTGTGDLQATFDTETMVLTWTITYDGLSGAATAAHFHGPADPGENAGPVVPISGGFDSPISGEATLTEDQAADLMAGKWYFNIHTAAHAGGELRGQVQEKDPDQQ